MVAIGFLTLLAGYTLTYWGGMLATGNHMSIGCVLLNINCSTNSGGNSSGGSGAQPTNPPAYNPSNPVGGGTGPTYTGSPNLPKGNLGYLAH